MTGQRLLHFGGVIMLFILLLSLGAFIPDPLAASQARGPDRTPAAREQPPQSLLAGSQSGWRIEWVDSGSVGEYSSLVLDSAGWPRISYYDFGDDDLEYAYKDASGWHFDTVDSAGYVGAYTSLALDSLERPHISYCSCTDASCGTCNDLKYAWHDGTEWQIEWADTTGDVGGYTSLVLVNDRPHISYYDFTNGDLEYAYKDSSGSPDWHTVDSAGDVGRYSSLAAYESHRYISYMEYHTDINEQHLKYAHYDGVTWQTETLDNSIYTGANSSLALCKTYSPGAPRITYWRNGELWYAHKWFYGDWSFVMLDSDPPGPTSLALDSLCRVGVSYFDLYSGDLRYTYEDAAGWHTETVDEDGDSWPYWSSLALDPSGHPHISYYDDSHFGLSYAYKVYVVHLPLILRSS